MGAQFDLAERDREGWNHAFPANFNIPSNYVLLYLYANGPVFSFSITLAFPPLSLLSFPMRLVTKLMLCHIASSPLVPSCCMLLTDRPECRAHLAVHECAQSMKPPRDALTCPAEAASNGVWHMRYRGDVVTSCPYWSSLLAGLGARGYVETESRLWFSRLCWIRMVRARD